MKNKIYEDPLELYNVMLRDISKAKKYVYLETYIYDDDHTGRRFKEALIKKAKQGVEVKVLLDAWGTQVKENFFSELILEGGEVRLFRRVKLRPKFFTHNHERDHKKLLVIDNKITYVGSTNISNECILWREATLKLNGNIAQKFKEIFLKSYSDYRKSLFDQTKNVRKIFSNGFELVIDEPSAIFQNVKKRMIKMIKQAKHQIIIETPYFVPDLFFRRALRKAAKRGIDVKLIIPKISDVRLVDILREKFLGKINQSGVKIYYYKPRILHSKLLLVDSEQFSLGSSNIDYRSFIHQFEVCVFGKDKDISLQIKKHMHKSMKDSEEFIYEKWKDRSTIHKLMEDIIYLFKQFI